MNSRHRAREIAFQLLYRFDLETTHQGTRPPEGVDLFEDINRHFDHFKIDVDLRPFAQELIVGTLREIISLDQEIEQQAQRWKVSRMGAVDRNLLRMGLYELKTFPEIPTSVTLDEAVELAKQFGTEETPAFINGILDALAKIHPKNPPESA